MSHNHTKLASILGSILILLCISQHCHAAIRITAEPSKINPEVGLPYEITTRISGRRPRGAVIEYHWMKNGKRIENAVSDKYLITSFSVNDIGFYQVVATVKQNGVIKEVAYSDVRPEFKAESQKVLEMQFESTSVYVEDGSNREIHIETDDPSETFTYSYNGQALTPELMTRYGIVFERKTFSRILIIRSITITNSGSYSATSSRGDTFYLTIHVFRSPDYLTIGKLRRLSPEGFKGEHHCVMENIKGANAADITWFFQPLPPAGLSVTPVPVDPSWRSEPVQDSPYSRYLRKDSIIKADEGVYICRVRDSNGRLYESSGELLIKVAGGGRVVTTCPAGYRKCNNGDCYPPSGFCNNVRDCTDGSDESLCEACDPIVKNCEYHANRAPTKKTFLVQWQCDGEDDCGNNFDESSCNDVIHRTCDAMTFKCQSGRGPSIPISFRCDNENDCADDEYNCQAPLIISDIGNPVQEVYVGGSATMKCEARGSPLPRVVWRFNWRCLPDAGKNLRFRVSNRHDDPGCTKTISELTISGITMADDGIYNCEALFGNKRAFSRDYILRVRQRRQF